MRQRVIRYIIACLLLGAAWGEVHAARLSLDGGYAGCIFRHSDVRDSISLLNLVSAYGGDEKKVGVFLGDGYRLRAGFRAWRSLHLVGSYGSQKGRKHALGRVEYDFYGFDVSYDYDVTYLYEISYIGLGLRYERPVLGWFSTYFEGLAGPVQLELRRVLVGDAFAILPKDVVYTVDCLAYELRGGMKLYTWRGGYIEWDVGYRYATSEEVKDESGAPAYEYDSYFQRIDEPLGVDFSGFLVTFRVGMEVF